MKNYDKENKGLRRLNELLHQDIDSSNLIVSKDNSVDPFSKNSSYENYCSIVNLIKLLNKKDSQINISPKILQEDFMITLNKITRFLATKDKADKCLVLLLSHFKHNYQKEKEKLNSSIFAEIAFQILFKIFFSRHILKKTEVLNELYILLKNEYKEQAEEDNSYNFFELFDDNLLFREKISTEDSFVFSKCIKDLIESIEKAEVLDEEDFYFNWLIDFSDHQSEVNLNQDNNKLNLVEEKNETCTQIEKDNLLEIIKNLDIQKQSNLLYNLLDANLNLERKCIKKILLVINIFLCTEKTKIHPWAAKDVQMLLKTFMLNSNKFSKEIITKITHIINQKKQNKKLNSIKGIEESYYKIVDTRGVVLTDASGKWAAKQSGINSNIDYN